MFCDEENRYGVLDEDIQDPVSEQLKHYACPKGAHKQLHLFTHWFEYVDLGKELQAKGHTLRDVMITYTNWRERYQKTVPLLVGDMEAWTHVKYIKGRFPYMVGRGENNTLPIFRWRRIKGRLLGSLL